MKKYFLIVTAIILSFSSCSEFLTLQPEYLINENNYYNTANDFETALIGNYSELQRLHNFLLYLLDLTTDNANIQWTSPTNSESEYHPRKWIPQYSLEIRFFYSFEVQ